MGQWEFFRFSDWPFIQSKRLITKKMDDTVFQVFRPAARLRVTGEDAATFLQGQFSNDLRRAEPDPATYGLWLNHKGRVLADSLVLQRGPNDFEVISPNSPAATIRERLETYIIADDVSVADATEGCAGLTIDGEGSAAALGSLGIEGPAPRQFVDRDGLCVLPARCGGGPSWMVVGEAARINEARAKLAAAGAREVGAEVLARRRIAAGIPSVPDELGPDDLPNEGGLERDAISYTKGCYLGQEVMARLHNLGQVRRRLFVVRIEAGEPPVVRTPLFQAEQKVGELRAAVALEHGGWIGLAMLSTHRVAPGAEVALPPGEAARVRVEALAPSAPIQGGGRAP